MGKAEGNGENWHGHVTALTVSPDYRRLGLAATLMKFLEDVSEKYEWRVRPRTCVLMLIQFQEASIFRRSLCAGQQQDSHQHVLAVGVHCIPYGAGVLFGRHGGRCLWCVSSCFQMRDCKYGFCKLNQFHLISSIMQI